jgi:nucleotide-binding universal stress UspA family protein
MVNSNDKGSMKPLLAKNSRAQALPATPLKFQRILVAVDFSEESRNALACAAEFAARFDASLTLVHVVEPHFGPPDADVPPLTGSASDASEHAEAKLELNALAEQMLGACRVVETMVRAGLAFFEIAEAAKILGADLIVVGTHGYTGIKRALLGSTAEKIVRHAPCPVLVARGAPTELGL